MRGITLIILLGLVSLAGCGGGDRKGHHENADKPKMPDAKSTDK